MINSCIGISGSVGRFGKNQLFDVKTVQTRLNALMGTSRKELAVDGKVGSKTIGTIKDFQASVVRLRYPDGRVDPDNRTIRALNDPNSAPVWQRMCIPPVANPVSVANDTNRDDRLTPAEKLLAKEAANIGDSAAFDEFRRELIDKSFPNMKKFLGSIGRAEDARKVIAAWSQLRKWGFSTSDARDVMKAISGMKGRQFGALDAIGSPTSKFGRFLGSAGSKAGMAGHVITMIEVADKFEQGDYLYGTSELYKHFMGKAIPWAGMVEGLQSLVEAIAPGSVKNTRVFKIIRACDPIGLGASGIDSMTTLVLGTVHLIQTGNIDMARLSRLVDRMKQGPTKVFAEMGEDLGDSVYEMSKWRKDDWSYAVKSIPGFIASLF
ncbi:MAG: peptidoglycan-binding protein [Pseudomonadota bacterium]